MRKLAAAGLLLISACDHRTAAVKPTWEQPGLVATAEVGDRTELRVYSPADGRLLSKVTLPPAGAAGRRFLCAPGHRWNAQEGLRRSARHRAEVVRKSLIRSASSAGCSTTIACEASASEM
jgi:hypothetical protein